MAPVTATSVQHVFVFFSRRWKTPKHSEMKTDVSSNNSKWSWGGKKKWKKLRCSFCCCSYLARLPWQGETSLSYLGRLRCQAQLTKREALIVLIISAYVCCWLAGKLIPNKKSSPKKKYKWWHKRHVLIVESQDPTRWECFTFWKRREEREIRSYSEMHPHSLASVVMRHVPVCKLQGEWLWSKD